jgi:hypothetical protein
MVKIIGLKVSVNSDGKSFVSLKLEGSVEAIQSQKTGKFYLTNRTCFILSTFDKLTAEALIGTSMPGSVGRTFCDPYEYTVKETGEVISLSHRYEYKPEEVTSSVENFQPMPVAQTFN